MPTQEKKYQNVQTGTLDGKPIYTSGVGATPTISSASLSASPDNLNIPPTPPSTPTQPLIDTSLQSITDAYAATTPEEAQGSDLQKQILASLSTLGGKGAKQGTLEQQANLPEQRKQLQDIMGQLQGLQKESLAIPLQIQEEAKGRGVTAAGVAPIQAGRLRENAIKSLGLAAIGQTLQGNISLAESSIARAIDLEFEPEQQKLDTLKQLYTFNKDALERVDKKRADNLNIMLGERTRILGEQKADKEEIYKIGSTAQKFGADAGTIQKVFNAKSREEAVAAAGQFLTDPKAKYELEDARLSNILTRERIATEQKQRSLLGEPTAAEKKAEAAALKNAETAIPILQDKIDLIDSLKASKGLRGSVGAYKIARFTPFSVDKSDRVAFIAGVNQLVNKETIDTLVNLKERGGTLGALSDQERVLLQTAASRIGSWQLADDKGKVYGYEVDESTFKQELDNIKNLSKRALEKATGSVYSPAEEDAWGEIETMRASTQAIISGESYFR